MAKISVDTGQAGYAEDQAARFFDNVAREARRIPGVEAVTMAGVMPLFGSEVTSLVAEGARLPSGERVTRPFANTVGDDYFTTLGIPIVAGRGFDASDRREARRVVIVNEVFARRLWPGGGAVGQRFRLGSDTGPVVEVVGVAKTARYLFFFEPPQSMVYFPYRQMPRTAMVLLAATGGDSAAALEPLQRVLQAADPDVPTFDVQTIEQFYDSRATGIGVVTLSLIGAMCVMGLILTTIGLYGLVSYAVSRRTREIGIRIAIGASSRRVLGMVLRQGMRPVWPGMLAGCIASLAATRWLPSAMPIDTTYDPRWLMLIVPLIFVTMIAAAYVPARRASRVDPTVALRYD
jgi:predicted permease